MKNKKVYYSVLVVLLLIFVVSTTYAFFAPQQGGTTSTNATVTSNTTDLLTFSINRDISFTVTQALFAQNGQNQSGDATATASLTPNNKTGSATMNYYLYLNLQNNPTVYSSTNTNHDPELMLQVYDGNNQLVTLTGLGTQKTIKGVTGYDITGVSGLKTLLNNHAISATNNTAAIENWRIVITLINHDFNQNDNTGKTISAEIIISREEVNVSFTGTIYRNNTVKVVTSSSIIPENGAIWCDIETSSGNQYNCFYGQSECEQFLIDGGYTDTDTCEQIAGTSGVVSPYETSVNAIRTARYNVYCPIGENNPICTNSWYFTTEQDCLENVFTNDTCTAGTITKPYYLKHEVQDDIIESSEVCLWYNNHEFCMAPNYWDTDGETTQNKLKTAMETTFETQANNCSLYNNRAYCYFGDFNCGAKADGNVYCQDYSFGYCSAENDGSSICG